MGSRSTCVGSNDLEWPGKAALHGSVESEKKCCCNFKLFWHIWIKLSCSWDAWPRNMPSHMVENEKALRGCSKAETKNFAPPQTSFPRARDGQNLISWRWSIPLPTNPVWWGSMHAISSFRGNRPTHTQTHAPTRKQTGPITIHCAAA